MTTFNHMKDHHGIGPAFPQPDTFPVDTSAELYIRKSDGEYERTSIDLGVVPPNFVHTWAIDLETDLPWFELDTEGISLAHGDVLKVANLKAEVLATFSYGSDLPWRVGLGSSGESEGNASKRIYLILETSPEEKPRRFHVDVLRHRVISNIPMIGDRLHQRAFLVANDIAVEQMADHKLWEKVRAPWHQALPGFDCPEPKADQGWHLVGENLNDPGRGFYSLVYYNEKRWILGFYLYNESLTDATCYKLTVSLQRWERGEFVDLCGPIFPRHWSPQRWSSAEVTLPSWQRASWIYWEIPVFYPMAENLPIDTSVAPPWRAQYTFRSLYEEPFYAGAKNVVLAIQIQALDVGNIKLEGTATGKAVGLVIQESGGPKGYLASLSHAIETATGVIKTAGEVYKAGRDIIAAGADVGLGDIASGLGALASAYKLVSGLFADDKPTRTSILLNIDLRLSLEGGVVTRKQTSIWRLYLPGRFSIIEARSFQDLEYEREAVDARLPRCEKLFGLGGIVFDPAGQSIDVWLVPRMFKGFFAAVPGEHWQGVVVLPSTGGTWPVSGRKPGPWWTGNGFWTDDQVLLRMTVPPIVYNQYAGWNDELYGQLCGIRFEVWENIARNSAEPHVFQSCMTPVFGGGREVGSVPKVVKYSAFSPQTIDLEGYALVKGAAGVSPLPVADVICHWIIPDGTGSYLDFGYPVTMRVLGEDRGERWSQSSDLSSS